MTSTLHRVTRARLMPCMIASQFIRLNGRLGWLTMPENPRNSGFEFRISFGVRILPYYDGMFDSAEQTTTRDLEAFYQERKGISEAISNYYETSSYTGD